MLPRGKGEFVFDRLYKDKVRILCALDDGDPSMGIPYAASMTAWQAFVRWLERCGYATRSNDVTINNSGHQQWRLLRRNKNVRLTDKGRELCAHFKRIKDLMGWE